MKRPENFVTQALRQAISKSIEAGKPAPDVSEPLVVWLEELYPPRCYEPDKETLEQHLQYAGAVELTQALRAQLAHRGNPDGPTEEDDDALREAMLKEKGVQ